MGTTDKIDMSEYWSFVFIPTMILLIFYLLYAILNSRDTQTMSSRGLNSSVNAVLKNIHRI